MARRFFANPKISSEITGIDDLNLRRKIYSLRMLRCSHKQKKFLPMLVHSIMEVMIQKQRNM